MISIFLKTVISICFVLAIVSCSNNTNADTSTSAGIIPMVQKTNVIVGVWRWAGSATDLNDNLKLDADEWQYKDKQNTEDYAKLGVNVEDFLVTFNSDGTGYAGNDKTDLFTWKEVSANTYTSMDKHKDISKFTLNEKGQLIQDTSSEMVILNKKRWLVTAEMMKKIK